MSWIKRTFENKLKKRLAKLPIESLLIEMTNNSYFFPYNFWKKYFDKNSIESGKWISWFATRQAEKIDDKSQADILKETIENETTEKLIKRKAYFCLGHLTKNLKDKEIFEYLVNKLETETEDNQETILIALTNAIKPIDYNLNPIVNILKNGNLRMKTNATISLKHSENPNIETHLLNSFQEEKNKHLQEMIATTLRDIGTEKSLPILIEKLKIAKGNEYRYFLESAVKEIETRMHTTANTRYKQFGDLA